MYRTKIKRSNNIYKIEPHLNIKFGKKIIEYISIILELCTM